MVYENAIFHVTPEKAASFIAAVEENGSVFPRWRGCAWVRLLHCIEVPDRFILVICWDSVEAHMAFRAAPEFEAWREATADYREVPVDMTHYEVVVHHS